MDDVVIEDAGPIGLVRLNRPDRGNSVTPAVVTELGGAVRHLAAMDAVEAIVLTGTGSVFCAGADVQEMYAVWVADGADGLMDYLADVWMPAVQATVRAIWNVPKPLVAAYNGAATAGGLDFGLACDMRVGARSARFAESYVNLGMVPVAGGAYLLPLLIGIPAATRLLASGAFVDASEAKELGFVDVVTDEEDLLPRAYELAAELSHGEVATFAETKQVTRAAAGAALEEALRESYEANVRLIARDEVRARILAVMERYSTAKERRADARA